MFQIVQHSKSDQAGLFFFVVSLSLPLLHAEQLFLSNSAITRSFQQRVHAPTTFPSGSKFLPVSFCFFSILLFFFKLFALLQAGRLSRSSFGLISRANALIVARRDRSENKHEREDRNGNWRCGGFNIAIHDRFINYEASLSLIAESAGLWTTVNNVWSYRSSSPIGFAFAGTMGKPFVLALACTRWLVLICQCEMLVVQMDRTGSEWFRGMNNLMLFLSWDEWRWHASFSFFLFLIVQFLILIIVSF